MRKYLEYGDSIGTIEIWIVMEEIVDKERRTKGRKGDKNGKSSKETKFIICICGSVAL